MTAYGETPGRPIPLTPVRTTLMPCWRWKMRPQQEKKRGDSIQSRSRSVGFRKNRPRITSPNREVIPPGSLERFPLLPQHRGGDLELQDLVGAFIDAADADIREVAA